MPMRPPPWPRRPARRPNPRPRRKRRRPIRAIAPGVEPRSGRGHPLSGTQETWVAVFAAAFVICHLPLVLPHSAFRIDGRLCASRRSSSPRCRGAFSNAACREHRPASPRAPVPKKMIFAARLKPEWFHGAVPTEEIILSASGGSRLKLRRKDKTSFRFGVKTLPSWTAWNGTTSPPTTPLSLSKV